jgi:hypothetical protein
MEQTDNGLLVFGAGVGKRPTQRRDRLFVEVVFPVAEGAFSQAESPGSFGMVVAEFGECEGTRNGALAGAVFDDAACLLAGSCRGVLDDGPHHTQVLLEEVFAG